MSFACQSICSPLLSIIHLSTYVFIYHFSSCPYFFVGIACLTYVQYPSLFSLPLFLTFWSYSPGAHSSHALNIFKFNVIIDRAYASLQLPHLLPQGTTLLADEVSYRTSPELGASGWTAVWSQDVTSSQAAVELMHGKGEPHFLAELFGAWR